MFLIWHIKMMQLINPTPIWATMQNKKANMILMLKWNMTTSIYWDINISILKIPHYSFVFLCIDLPRICQPPCYIVGTEDAWVQTLCNKTFKPTIVLPAREHTRTHTPIASLRTSGSLRRVPPLLSAPPPPLLLTVAPWSGCFGEQKYGVERGRKNIQNMTFRASGTWSDRARGAAEGPSAEVSVYFFFCVASYPSACPLSS